MKLRKNVAAVIINSKGLILVGKRSDVYDSWQLPQGGVDKNETEEDAVLREVEEETGLNGEVLEIIKKSNDISYVYPPEIKKNKFFDGQNQKYFLIKIADTGFQLLKSKEFVDFQWLTKEKIVEIVVSFKKKSYIEAFRQLFGEDHGN